MQRACGENLAVYMQELQREVQRTDFEGRSNAGAASVERGRNLGG